MPQIVNDNFTRANANPIGGNWTTLTNGDAALQLLSNTARASAVSASGAYWNANNFPASSYVEIAYGAKIAGTTGAPLLRVNTGITTGYELISNGALGAASIFAIFPFPAGPQSTARFGPVLAAGDIVRFSAQKDVLSVLVNNVGVYIFQDSSTLAAGLSGVRLVPSGATTSITLTDWAAGTEGDSRFVQEFSFGQDIAITSTQGTFPSNNAAGNLLVCIVASNKDNANPSIVDTNNNSWKKINISNAGAGIFMWFFYVLTCAAGANTLTVSLPGGGQHIVCEAAEYNLPNAVLDQSLSTTGNSSTPLGNLTTTQNNALMIAGLAVQPGINPPAAGTSGAIFRGAFNSEIKLFDSSAATAGSNTLSTFTGPSQGVPTAEPWFMLVASFLPGNPPVSNPYSVPDCRVPPAGPNSSRTVQGTKIYDVQTSSNPAIPPKDSRAAGAPVDSRVSPNIPQNSRTPGTFGPGE
jgi:hypothetical protein